MSAKGRPGGLTEFFSCEWRVLVRTVGSWLADASEWDAEDVVQDVAESLFESADPTAPIRNLSAYVYRALRNRVVDLYRSRRKETACSAEQLEAAAGDERGEAGIALERRQVRERLFSAIDGLPVEQRAVFLATELEGLKFRELALLWKTPIGTLLARKHRAVLSLREALTPLREELGGSA